MTGVRVVVTGIGVISSLGRGRAAQLDAVREGRSGVRAIRNFDATALLNNVAGEVDDACLAGEFAEHDRFTRLALIAAQDACAQAQLEVIGVPPHRIGTIIGTGLGGSSTVESMYHRLFSLGQTRLPPMTIPRSMYNAATSAVSAKFGAQGPGFSTVSACASGTHAIGQASHWIRLGMCDAAIAGAADAPMVPGVIRAWEGLRVLAPAGEDPAAACRPFSADRRGIVLAEGSAVFVLEREESARRRGAEILGEIAGFGLSMDGGHITDPTVEGPLRAMQQALDDAKIDRGELDYINAHGTATRANDSVETAAIRQLLGSRADEVPVSSTKSMHGHAMGAAGAIELAVALIALNDKLIPPTLHWSGGDPQCDLDYVPNRAREANVKSFLDNSFGFGGMNAVLAVRTARSMT